jgi:hypothetical protein
MNWMKEMVETATAATAIEKGDSPEGTKTLGELNLMAAKADERLKDIPKFARAHAVQLGDKFAKLTIAESAVFNPSMSPMEVTLSHLNLCGHDVISITRAVLVQADSKCLQSPPAARCWRQ